MSRSRKARMRTLHIRLCSRCRRPFFVCCPCEEREYPTCRRCQKPFPVCPECAARRPWYCGPCKRIRRHETMEKAKAKYYSKDYGKEQRRDEELARRKRRRDDKRRQREQEQTRPAEEGVTDPTQTAAQKPNSDVHSVGGGGDHTDSAFLLQDETASGGSMNEFRPRLVHCCAFCGRAGRVVT